MKKTISVVFILALLLLSACSNSGEADQSTSKTDGQQDASTTIETKKIKPETIAGEDFDENGGADAYNNAGDNEESRYYKNPDFYNMKSNKELTIIPEFKTIQQTTEWSCGNASALMVLNHFGNTYVTEMELAEIMKSSTDLDTPDAKPGSANNFFEYGSDVKRMYDYFNKLEGFKVVETSYQESYEDSALISEKDSNSPADHGNLKPAFSAMSLYASENDDNTDKFVDDAKDSYFVNWLTGHLDAERPIMVEWGDWDGHWQVIIGYDNNGTPGIGDDMLIFADPYDTSDHWQDGYYYYPLERWFFMWKDRNVAPKPYQLQPYVIVDVEK